MFFDNEVFNIPKSPTQEIHSDILEQKGIRLWIKRDDLIRPRPSGNKWRKLKYNILAAREQAYETLLTFGGAYSNHIYATAAAGKRFGFQTIGVIRGERVEPLNSTLRFAESCGMHLLYIDRSTYREKHQPFFQHQLRQRFGNVYILPEGGTNTLALRGCSELVNEVRAQVAEQMDYWAVACGTGGTIAGILQGLGGEGHAIGISALKGDWMKDEVRQHLEKANLPTCDNWHIETRFHHGGYAKTKPELLDFIRQFQVDFDIALDPIYTGKLFFAIWKMLQADYFPKGSRVCVVHTGGLQG